jgi:hypothetical protein
MAQTLNTYTTLVQQEVDDTSAAARSVIQQKIREIYQEILQQAGKYFVSCIVEDETCTSGISAYPTAQDAIRVKQVAYKPVSCNNFRILSEISHEKYLNEYINRPNSLPVEFYFDGDVLSLAPTPNEAGIVRKVYQPFVSELTDTSIIPDRYTMVLLNGAVAKFKQWEDNIAGTIQYDRWKEKDLRNMILELSTQTKMGKPNFYC